MFITHSQIQEIIEDSNTNALLVLQQVRDSLYQKEEEAIVNGYPIRYFTRDLYIDNGVAVFETVDNDGIATTQEIPVEDLIGGQCEDYENISIS